MSGAKWEKVNSATGDRAGERIRRMPVPGGWVYSLTTWVESDLAIAAVFVPTPVEVHVCDHGYAARTCGLCERDGSLGGAR